jgi:hypothetical protein
MHSRSRSSWSRVSGDSSGPLAAWEPAAVPDTDFDGGSASGNGVSKLSGRPRRSARIRPLQT